MDWKKLLFGDYHYRNETEDGKKSIDIRMRFGLLPNLFLMGIIVGIIWFVFFKGK